MSIRVNKIYSYIHAEGCGFATEISPRLIKVFLEDLKKCNDVYCSGCGNTAPINEFVWEETNKSLKQ